MILSMEKYREQIRVWLKEKRRRQVYLAEEAGITPACLSQFLSGKRDINLATWEKIREVIEDEILT